jgi:hypothetical protein
VKIWRQLQPPSTLYKWKVWGVLKDIDFDLFCKFFDDLEYRQLWDRTTKALQIIDEFQDQTSNDRVQIIWWRVTIPFPFFYDRDVVFSRQRKQINELIIVYDKSVTHQKAPKMNDVIRIDTYNRYFICKKVNNGVELLMSYITALDPGGAIPKMIVNWGASIGCRSFLSQVRQGYAKYSQWLNSKQRQTTTTVTNNEGANRK